MRRTFQLISLTALLALVPAASAFAHAKLMGSTPRVSQALHRVPSVVVLRFDEPVSVPRGGVRAIAAGGRDMVVGLTTGTTAIVEARLRPKLAAGKYRVQWHVVADDGHVVQGTYRFKVRHGAAGSAAAPAEPRVMAHAPTGRATTTILLIAALGAAALALLSLVAVRRPVPQAVPVARRGIALDLGLIAVGAFCALSLIGVIAANQS